MTIAACAPRRPAAAFTIVQNEPVFLPIWERYYRRHFDADDLFVLDHDSTDPVTIATARRCNRVPIHRTESFHHDWLRAVVSAFQRFLLQSYAVVLFVEVDEIVAPDPALFPGGLREYIAQLPDDARVRRCDGWETLQLPDEPPIDWSRPILAQRAHGFRSAFYSKPLLSRVPLTWTNGFHHADGVPADDVDLRLRLLHLHRADFGYCLQRNRAAAARRWSASDLAAGLGTHNRMVDEDAVRTWFYQTGGRPAPVETLAASWRDVVI